MTTDEAATRDLARLVESAIRSAERRVGTGVVIQPFGFALTADGKGEELTAKDGKPDHALAELQQAAQDGLGSKRWRAVVMAYPCTVTPKGSSEKHDAIGLELRHERLPERRLVVPLVRDPQGNLKAAGTPSKTPNLWDL